LLTSHTLCVVHVQKSTEMCTLVTTATCILEDCINSLQLL
jgi:hypothetical protein